MTLAREPRKRQTSSMKINTSLFLTFAAAVGFLPSAHALLSTDEIYESLVAAQINPGVCTELSAQANRLSVNASQCYTPTGQAPNPRQISVCLATVESDSKIRAENMLNRLTCLEKIVQKSLAEQRAQSTAQVESCRLKPASECRKIFGLSQMELSDLDLMLSAEWSTTLGLDDKSPNSPASMLHHLRAIDELRDDIQLQIDDLDRARAAQDALQKTAPLRSPPQDRHAFDGS